MRDSRPTEEHAAIRRRRFCPACSGRFTTFERVQLRDLIVIKSDGRREDFDRDKLARSIRLAMNRRHIEPERLDQLITGIVRRLETGGDTDITSKVIGDEVMRALERTDPVGYLRYASVYQNFDSVDDFLKFIENQRRGGDTDDDAA